MPTKALTPSDFIDSVHHSRQRGFGIVPLIGAGLSAPSGVPIITEVKSYLHKCVARCLGLDLPEAWWPEASTEEISAGLARLDFHNFRRWLPGRDSWPPFGSPQNYRLDPCDWVARLKKTYLYMEAEAQSGHRKQFPELSVFQEAFGASADWRSLLLFLSRLRRVQAGFSTTDQSQHQLYLGAPNLDIIDTFFLNVVENKRPTLGHRMLARLAGPLRINAVLTTNFDDLLEQAFAETDNIFTTFDVHVDTGLPPYRDLEGRNAIVKLHGGRYGLRADYSLDRPPNDDDVRQFVSYLAGREISESEWYESRGGRQSKGHVIHRHPIAAKRHLLVVGLSASDERINSMLRTACETLSEFKVFWVSYRKDAAAGAADLLHRLFFNDQKRTPTSPAPHKTECYSVIRHQFPGLLFLQSYQELMHSLPSSRALFPSTPRLPVPPELIDATQHEKALAEYESQVHHRVDECIASTDCNPSLTRVVVMHAPRGRFFGASTAAARVFDQCLDQGKQCVWIDMDEVTSGNDLFEVMLHSIARKAGVTDWMPVLLQTDSSEGDKSRIENAQVREIARMTNNPHRKWILFLNGRSGAGINSLDEEEYEAERRKCPNGWLDYKEADIEADADPTASGDSLIQLLKRICGNECPNVTVVLLCYDIRRNNVIIDEGFFGRIRSSLTEIRSPIPIAGNALGADDDVEFVTGNLVQNGLNWANEVRHEVYDRHRFLYSLVLSNRIRYAAMTWSWPFHAGSRDSALWVGQANTWIDELEMRHVVRRKRGDFIWVHCDIRNALRKLLPKQLPELRDHEARIHDGLAEWYHKLLQSSDDTEAVFEIVYHRCRQCAALLRSRSTLRAHEKELLNSLNDARLTLDNARHGMLATGFSKGICRRLQTIRSSLIETLEIQLEKITTKPAMWLTDDLVGRIRYCLHQLREASIRLNRSIAREIGENTVAFQRHRELRIVQYAARFGMQDCESRNKQVAKFQKAWESHSAATRKRCARRMLNPHKYHKGIAEPIHEWIESCNELCTLGIGTRSYSYAEKCYRKVFERFDLPESLIDGTPVYDRLDNVMEWIYQTIPAVCESEGGRARHSSVERAAIVQQVIVGVIQTLLRCQQLKLEEGHAKHTMSRRISSIRRAKQYNEDALTAFRRARRCFELAVQLQKHVNVNAQAGSSIVDAQGRTRDNVHRKFDDRQRLSTQDALACSFLGDFDKAHRRLNEAEASLLKLSASRSRLEHAIIELHRTEILTHQAVFRSAGAGLPKMTSLADGRSRALRAVMGQQPVSLQSVVKAITGKKVDLAEMRTSQAFIDDAWQTSSRASGMLERNRKNVWWTTWFFELRLKLVELDVWLAVLRASSDAQSGKRILLSHLGLEAAAHGTPTNADLLADNSDRMVRLDLYRMARVVESYSNCLFGLVLWREMMRRGDDPDGNWSNLRGRQLEMMETVRNLSDALFQRVFRRRELDASQMGTSTACEGIIWDYIEYLLGDVRSVSSVDRGISPVSYIGRVLSLAEAGTWAH